MAGLSTPSRLSRWLPRPLGLCAVCRQWSPSAVCDDCVARFAQPRHRCLQCAIPLGLALGRCGACLREPPPFGRAVCAVDYGFPWIGLIGDFKFNGRVELAAALAGLLAAAVRREAGSAAEAEAEAGTEAPSSGGAGRPAAAETAATPTLVLPVPLAPARLRERGYNQAWAIARDVAARLGLPAVATLLQRPLATAHQAGLGRAERQRQLRGVFMVDPRRQAELSGRRVALVDDVMTTGATVQDAASTLLRAGAAAVEVWVLARTPQD